MEDEKVSFPEDRPQCGTEQGCVREALCGDPGPGALLGVRCLVRGFCSPWSSRMSLLQFIWNTDAPFSSPISFQISILHTPIQKLNNVI